MLVTESAGHGASIAFAPSDVRPAHIGFRHTPESYAEAQSLLGPEAKYTSDEYYNWTGRRDMLGEKPGEGVQVERVVLKGGQALVSTQYMYRVVEVPSGRILFEMQDFDGVTSTISSINTSRASDDEPYVIAVAYELVYAMENSRGQIAWADISVKPALRGRCTCCGTKDCGRQGTLWARPTRFEQSDNCRELERNRLMVVAEKLRNESKLMGALVTFETSEVIDDRYEWQFPPDMADYVDSLGEARIQWRRQILEEALVLPLASV